MGTGRFSEMLSYKDWYIHLACAKRNCCDLFGALYSNTLCTNEVSRYQFNCDQRTHHNYLELLPLYLVLMVRDNAASTQRSIIHY